MNGHPKGNNSEGQALDISGSAGSNHYNVISMAKGVVERADDGYNDNGPNGDNGEMGNCVYVRYPGNIVVRYMHLYKGSVTVKVGDTVDYGQVLGKMGNSGGSYGTHLHVDMWKGDPFSSNGTCLDVAAYLDAKNPRPAKESTNSLDGFLFIGDSITARLGASNNINNAIFKGVVSSTPAQWLNDEEVNGSSTYSSLPQDSDSIKGICIMLGTNNIGQASQMKQLLEKLHNKYPDKTIYVQKLLPCSTHNSQDHDNYNDEIKSFCDSTSYTVFIDTTNDVELDDGIHPSMENGCKTLAQNIHDAIVKDTENVEENTDDTEENEEENEDNEEGFQGCINIRRITPNKEAGEYKTNTGVKTINMKYVDKSTFEDYINNNNSKALEVFTLSDDLEEIITATWSYNGNSAQIEKCSSIRYRDLTSSYTMPFEYPLDFLINGRDEEFAKGLANLAMNAFIEFDVIDNVTTQKVVTTTRKYKQENGESNLINGSENYNTVITENAITTIEMTNIDAWWIKRKITLNNESSSNESHSGDVTNTVTLDDGSHETTVVTTDTYITTNETTVSYMEKESNEEKFVDLYKKYKDKIGQVLQPSWIFEMLERNEKTSNMVELTKYLLYKATENDYGVTNFDELELIDESYGIIDGGTSGLSGTEGEVYDFLMSKGMSAIGAAGVMGNIAQESGFNTGAISYDGAGSIGLCQWTGGRRTNLQNYAKSKGMNETDLQAQMEFLWKELTEGYSSLVQRMNNATSPSAAAVDFCDTFERPSVPNYPNRKSKAEQYYQAYKNNNMNGSSNNQCTFNINLYKDDGSVDQNKINQLKKEEDKIISNYRSYAFFNNNGLSYLQCTWWANARASTYLSKYGTKYKSYPTNWGNGGDYWQNNINGGWFNYGQTPKANSLLGYAASSTMGGWGHITYVEAVDPVNKKIYISHCSSGERWNGIYELPWSGALWGQKPQGYIYLDEPK